MCRDVLEHSDVLLYHMVDEYCRYIPMPPEEAVGPKLTATIGKAARPGITGAIERGQGDKERADSLPTQPMQPTNKGQWI